MFFDIIMGILVLGYGVSIGWIYCLACLKGTLGEEAYKARKKAINEESKRKFNEFVDSFKTKTNEDKIQELKAQIEDLKIEE